VDVLAAEGNLDDLAHGGAVVDEVDGGSAHCKKPPSESFCVASSSSRSASSINSVAERSTVRVFDLSPGRNLYDPLSMPLHRFTTCTTASSPIMSPLSACVTFPFSKKMIPSI